MMYIMIGGAVGACLRFAVSECWLKYRKKPQLMTAVFIINISGCVMLGWVLASPLPEGIELLFVSMLGGFTTFSTFCMEAYELWGLKKRKQAMIYLVTSIIGSLFGFIVGWNLRA
ncbi:fluoride efflux transporter FluC [Shouchella tritolerans]|uniref:fluoride efflux transporter FluC n=1 Tax=Shouchella tritolerans TaxID=2979466 RepID=UPI0007DBF5A2|nr:CrcB family protein [Shouchella tritolerans]